MRTLKEALEHYGLMTKLGPFINGSLVMDFNNPMFTDFEKLDWMKEKKGLIGEDGYKKIKDYMENHDNKDEGELENEQIIS